jgi:hypothetical protein
VIPGEWRKSGNPGMQIKAQIRSGQDRVSVCVRGKGARNVCEGKGARNV